MRLTETTLDAITTYHSNNPDKVVALSFSGGKDSTALVGVYLLALKQGLLRPNQFCVMHSNTTIEMPFMEAFVQYIKTLVESKGVTFYYLTAPLKHRFIYSVIGRGVAIPNRNFRWCTDKLKIKPLQNLLKTLPNHVTATGERLGESTVRDKKLSGCGSSECGIKEQAEAMGDVIRPIINWQTCQVWDFLFMMQHEGVLPNAFDLLSNLYSINEDAKGSLRTGCIGCPLITKDRALGQFVIDNQGYTPLTDVGGIWKRLTLPENRLTRKGYGGKQVPGAIKVEARVAAWDDLMRIEARVQEKHPEFTLLDSLERKATQEALAAGTYPKGY